MMYPRLKLARNLLRDDGVIFISIDDNEQANLKKLCDEIFGEENFISNVIWHKRYAASNDAKGIPVCRVRIAYLMAGVVCNAYPTHLKLKVYEINNDRD